MFANLEVSEAAVNHALKDRFLDRLHALQDTAFHQVGLRLCEMVGDWLFLCPGTRPESPGGNHHEGEGGLAEHLLGVENIARLLASRYATGEVRREVLSFSALFHDIGKCFEYSEKGETPYASLGHVAISLMLIPRLLEEFGAEDAEVMAVSHCLASHHGRFAEGALVEPMTKEAYILACADRLDANLWRHNMLGGASGIVRGREGSRLNF